MISFASSLASAFTLKDLLQLAGVLFSMGGVVWFLARRLSSIETKLNVMDERQKNWISGLNRLEGKVDHMDREIQELRERMVKMEAQKE